MLLKENERDDKMIRIRLFVSMCLELISLLRFMSWLEGDSIFELFSYLFEFLRRFLDGYRFINCTKYKFYIQKNWL